MSNRTVPHNTPTVIRNRTAGASSTITVSYGASDSNVAHIIGIPIETEFTSETLTTNLSSVQIIQIEVDETANTTPTPAQPDSTQTVETLPFTASAGSTLVFIASRATPGSAAQYDIKCNLPSDVSISADTKENVRYDPSHIYKLSNTAGNSQYGYVRPGSAYDQPFSLDVASNVLGTSLKCTAWSDRTIDGDDDGLLELRSKAETCYFGLSDTAVNGRFDASGNATTFRNNCEISLTVLAYQQWQVYESGTLKSNVTAGGNAPDHIGYIENASGTITSGYYSSTTGAKTVNYTSAINPAGIDYYMGFLGVNYSAQKMTLGYATGFNNMKLSGDWRR